MGIFIPVVGLGLQQQSVYRRADSSSTTDGSSHLKLPGAVLRDAIEEEGGYEALINHITLTTLAGIEAVRQQVELRERS